MAKVLLSLDGNALREIQLSKLRTLIGRRPHNDIQINNLAVSGEHAWLEQVNGQFFVADRGSTNGTLLNGKRVESAPLKDGDEVQIGKYVLKFFLEKEKELPEGTDFEKTMMIQRPVGAVASATAASVTGAKAARPVPMPAQAVRAARAKAAVDTVAEQAPAVVRVLTGAHAGRELELSKSLTTLGKAGSQVAVITRKQNSYYLSHVEGPKRPLVNGQPIGDTPHKLNEEDLIELAGIRMAFFFR